jgi:tetratricopeptide (TPR) repeat protein
VLGDEHPDTAMSYQNLASNQDAQGQYAEAEKGLHKALAIRRKVLGEEHPDTAQSYNDLAYIQYAQGQYAEAEEGYRTALAIYRKVLGEEHLHTATSYNNLAMNQHAQSKYAQAEQGYRKALAIQRKLLGEEHPDTAKGYNNLAYNQQAQGKYAEAEEGFRQALAIQHKVLGEDNTHTAHSYNNLAYIQNAQGQYAQAEKGYRQALAIRRKVLGEEHPDTARIYNNLAYNQDAQGKYKEAEEGHRKALAIHRKVLGEEHPLTVQAYSSLAANQYAQGKYSRAEELWRRGTDAFAKARLHIAATGLERATQTSEQSSLPSLAAVLARNGKPEEAWQRFEESLARGTWDDLSTRQRRTPAEQARQTQLVSRIERLDKILQSLATGREATPQQSQRRDELLSQLRQAQDELADFTHKLEKKYGPVAGQVLDRQQIQAALPTDAALVGWLDISVRAKAADPNGEHWAVLLRSSGDPLWLRLHGSGTGGSWTEVDRQLPGKLRTALQFAGGRWQPVAERLQQKRLQPLLKHLQGVRHLIVLPSRALAGVPIEVIAEGYTVSYAHSGSMYAYFRHLKAASGKGLLALADPIFETTPVVEEKQPLPPGGVLLTVVVPGSNAARAGLRPNDVLLRYNGTALGGPADFRRLVPSVDPDQSVPVLVWRDGKTRQEPVLVQPGKLGVVLADKPAPPGPGRAAPSRPPGVAQW